MNVGRYLRTLATLEPTQIAHRLRLRFQRRIVRSSPGFFADRWTVHPTRPVGLPSGFVAVDANWLGGRWDVDAIADGRFTFLNKTRDLGDPPRWDPDDASQLWLFHHHYWEWAWALVGSPDRDAARATFARQWRSWREQTTFGTWNAWAAYPASLRAWVLVNVYDALVAGTDMAETMIQDLGLHAGFLRRNVELDVGGNHILKNIKAMVGLAVFLHDDDLLSRALRLLDREIGVQVLADGGHYELSPSYHCQVLADLLDIQRLLEADGRSRIDPLDVAIERMRIWLGAMLMPDGDLPRFNDCEPVDPALLDLLAPIAPEDQALTVLRSSGYVVVRQGAVHLVADVGQPGPSSPPGHIHADCLSFELAVDGRRVVVDSGTSEYGSGPRRQHERSTAAHNTIEIDGTDQTEVWGAFRAGRRARATLESAGHRGDSVVVTASHDGYRHLPGSPLHRRTWTITTSAVEIEDEISGAGRHRVAARIHLAGEDGADRLRSSDVTAAAGSIRLDRICLEGPYLRSRTTSPRSPSVSWCRGTVAHGFGILGPAVVAITDAEAELPAQLTTTITVVAPARPID